MEINLPSIDLSGIEDAQLRNKIETQIGNAFEKLAGQIAKLATALELANEEIARLKEQPKKPHFSSNNNSSSVTSLLREKKKWKKKAKQVSVDQEV